MKVSDLKLAVKCCTTRSIEWDDTCGSCPLNKEIKTVEDLSKPLTCIDDLITALAKYLPEDTNDDSNNNQR